MHTMKNITKQGPQELGPSYKPGDNSFEDMIRAELMQQIAKVVRKLKEMVVNHRVNWFVVQQLLSKINEIATQLKDNQMQHQMDLDKIREDLQALIDDIKNIEQYEKKNGVHFPPTAQMKELAQKFAKDFKQFKTDAISFLKDAMHGAKSKIWQQGNFPSRILNILAMIGGEPINTGDGTGTHTIEELIKSGNIDGLAKALQYVGYLHNDKDSKGGSEDVLDHWMNGGDKWSDADGIDSFTTVILPESSQENNLTNQQDMEKLNSIYSAGTNFVTNMTQLFGALVKHQTANGG